MTDLTNPVAHKGRVNTNLDCHNCSRGFVAEIDYDVDGNHIVECPRCGHEHCRVITAGRVTGDRWSAREQRDIKIDKRRVWKSDSMQGHTSIASEFIRQRWLNRGNDSDGGVL